jgi:hypothetical protein
VILPTAVPVGLVRAERKSIVKARDFVDRVEAISPVEIRARVTGYLDEVRASISGSRWSKVILGPT